MDPCSYVLEDGLHLFGGDHVWRQDLGEDGLSHFVDLLLGHGRFHQGVGAALGGGVPALVRGGIGDGILALPRQDHLTVHHHVHPPVHGVLGVGFLQIDDGLAYISAAVHHAVQDGRRIVHQQRQGEGHGGFVPNGVHGPNGEGLGLVTGFVGGLEEGKGRTSHVLRIHQLLR